MTRTVEEYLALLRVRSCTNIQDVYVNLETLGLPLSLTPPPEGARFATILNIGEFSSPKAVTITFSKHGSLCAVDTFDVLTAFVRPEALDPTLATLGWSRVPESDRMIVLYSKTGATVDDCFFGVE